MTKAEYIRKMYSILVPMCAKNGFHNVAAGMIAQSIQEGWNSKLATTYHNYWGMKTGSGFKGKTVAMNNKAGNDPAVYRTYPTMEAGCEGYFQFLNYSRYKPLKNCTTDIEYLNKIGPCGWNDNEGYGDRCEKHLPDVYAVLNQSVPALQLWQIGKTYTTQQDLNIRFEPNGDKKPFEKLTANAKAHAFIGTSGEGILKRGTRVTVKDVQTIGSTVWLKIPSGWICGKNSRNIYVL